MNRRGERPLAPTTAQPHAKNVTRLESHSEIRQDRIWVVIKPRHDAAHWSPESFATRSKIARLER